MNTVTFENYLMEVHAKDYHGTDDAMPDDFERWLGELEADQMFLHAEGYAMTINRKLRDALELADKAVSELQKIRDMAKI